MQNSLNINKKNYNSQESQTLLSEFSILLTNITSYVEERERYIISLENQLKEQSRIKLVLKNLVRRVIDIIKRIVSFVIKKFKDKFRSYTK